MSSPTATTQARRRGITLVEVAISSVIVSLALVASVRLIGEAHTAHAVGARKMQAALLADTLLSEIITLPYEDPAAPGSLGPETGETDRADFNDVDDYHEYTQTDPTLWNGDPIEWAAGWTWTVIVEYVEDGDLIKLISDLGELANIDLGDILGGLFPFFGPDPTLKVITVYVEDPRGSVQQVSAVRTAGGVGDVRVPSDHEFQDLVSVTVGGGGGAAPVTVTGPLLELPEPAGGGGQ